jgi:hypothetical protein
VGKDVIETTEGSKTSASICESHSNKFIYIWD